MSTNTDGIEYIYTRFITRNGKRIYHPKGGLYKFPKRSKKTSSQNLWGLFKDSIRSKVFYNV